MTFVSSGADSTPFLRMDETGRLLAQFRCKCGIRHDCDVTCSVCGMTVSTVVAAVPLLVTALFEIANAGDVEHCSTLAKDALAKAGLLP